MTIILKLNQNSIKTKGKNDSLKIKIIFLKKVNIIDNIDIIPIDSQITNFNPWTFKAFIFTCYWFVF